jgi:hypothetical protein
MIESQKTLALFFLAAFFALALACPFSWAQDGVNITWQEETFSADLSGVPLERVLEHLLEEEDIWFRVHKSVADYQVSVQFTDLSLEQGLRRLFAGLDYILEFDGEGNPCGIVILGEKESARGRAEPAKERNVSRPRRVAPGPAGPGRPPAGADHGFEEEPSAPFGGPYGPAGVTKAPPSDASVDRRSPYGPPPGAEEEMDPAEASADTLSPYGPTQGRDQGEEDSQDTKTVEPSDASTGMQSPYGPGDVKPGSRKSTSQKGETPPQPVESAQEAGKGQQ